MASKASKRIMKTGFKGHAVPTFQSLANRLFSLACNPWLSRAWMLWVHREFELPQE